MKTNQVMIRHMGEFSVEQRTADGFFDGASLLRQWNSIERHKQRRISRFFEMESTKEFLKALVADENERKGHSAKMHIGDNQQITVKDLIVEVKGKNTKNGKQPDKVWLNPVLFIKFAMWINPTFEVQVIRFVYDQMIEFRKEAGDAYNDLSAATQKLIGKNSMRHLMPKVANAINFVVFNCNEKMIRNKVGEESKMKELFYLEHKLADLINEGFINTYKELIKYLRDRWIEKFQPKALSIDNK